MRLISKLSLGMLSLLALAIIAVLLYFGLADLSRYKDDIQAAASDALGLDVVIDGSFDLQVGGKTELDAGLVSVSNPGWSEDSVLASADRIHVVINTRSIFFGPIDIESLDVMGARANLERRANGDSNWEPSSNDSQPTATDKGSRPNIRRLLVEGFDVSYLDSDSEKLEARFETFALDPQTGGALRFAFNGAFEHAPIHTALEGSGLIDWIDDQLVVSDAQLSVDGGDFSFDGALDLEAIGLSGGMNVTAEGEDLALLGSSFGASGLPSTAYEISARANVVPTGVEFDDLVAKLGDNELSGSLSIMLDGERPMLNANIHSPHLDLRSPKPLLEISVEELAEDLAENLAENFSEEPTREPESEPDPESEPEPESEIEPLFSDEPLQYSWLDTVNIAAEVFVNETLIDGDQLDDVNLRLRLNDGSLVIDPFGFNSRGGELSGKLELNREDDTYVLDLNADAKGMRPGFLVAEEQDPATIPPLDVILGLSGRGNSLHEIMSGANGSIDGFQRRGQIDLQAAGVLFSDLITSILRTLNPLDDTESHANLECGVYKVAIADGTATIEEFALQSEKLTIVSSGTVDLATEEIDLALRTKTREGLGVSVGGIVNSFLKIGGSIREPSLGVDAAGSVTATGAAVATGGLSVLAKGLWDRVSAEADMCKSLKVASVGDWEAPSE